MLPAAIANRYAVLELRNGLKPNPYPHLTIAAREKIVVAISPPEDPAPSSAALATRVDVNVTNATAQQILRVEGILQGYAEKLNRFLPDGTKYQEALIALKSIYEKFYSVMSQPGSSQVSDDEIDRLNQIIEAAIKEQNQTIDAEIYNFFALYYSVPSIQERENLKQKILGLRDQIVLSDESLQTLMRNCAPDGKIYLTPREINQVFLTALLVDPAVWTESFASFLLHVIKFVRGEEFSSHLGLELQRSSYGDGLLNSLTTLYIFRCAHVSTTANLDILNLVVLDQQINKHYREFWNYFATLVNLPDIRSIKEARRPIFIFLLILLMTKDVVCGADKLLTQQNVNAICCNVKYASEIARALYKLDSENILTPDNFDAIINNVRYAPEMAIAFCALNAADILTLGNRDAIIRNVQYVDSIASELSALRNAHMLTQGNFNVIINNAQYVPLITDALDYLRRVNILTQDTFDAIISNAQYADEVCRAPDNVFLTERSFQEFCDGVRQAHQPSPSSLTVPGQSITFWQADRRDDRDQDASAPAELLPGQA